MLFCLSNKGLKWAAILVWLWCLLASAPSLRGQVVISEILVNPPGTDIPNEYIELRGPPNQILAAGTYFVAVEGDTNGNPGTIQNVFDLSGKAIGGNGYLVLLQKTNTYIVNPNATILVNTKGPGWGSGSTSSIGHRGESGQTDLENGSMTFFLIRSATPPAVGADIDVDDNGVPDGPYTSWTILDSVGILDDSGLGDIAYGAINFRHNPAATAAGSIVAVSFNPDYVGRNGSTTGSTSLDWVAGGSLAGTAPNWSLTSGNTAPPNLATAPLNHIGGPNFGAAAVPGVVAVQSARSTDVNEGSGVDTYNLLLNTTPTGPVTIQVDVSGQVEISINGGATFGTSRTLTFNNTSPQTVMVRALADNTIDASPHIVPIRHRITVTADTAHYPTTALTPVVNVNVMERDTALLSELKVNPPGSDEPNEFIEIKGPPNALLTNIYFVAIEGDASSNPGVAKTVINLSSVRIGSSGLLIIVGNGSPYFIPTGTTAVYDSHLNTVGGTLGNGSVSFLLVSSPVLIVEGADLDGGDNGFLEGLPAGSFIMDSIAWTDGDSTDVVYGGAVLNLPGGTPDAATRFGWDNTPRSATAWFFGQLKGPAGSTLEYNQNKVSANFPFGTTLSPGIFQNSAPGARNLMDLCGVIGDPHNPTLTFRLIDAESPPSALSVTVSSSNSLVLPNSQLTLTPLGDGWYNLAFNPIGVGYSLITLDVSDDDLVGHPSFLYAASAMGRPGGSFHIGASDGSTAIAIDSNWMLVGDDENEVLRLYNRRESGFPVWQFDVTPFLGLTDIEAGVPREIDIEASTRVGNRLFFIGSHSHSSTAEGRTNRSRIFAVDLSGTGTNLSLSYVGRYDYLKLDLASWDANNAHGKGADYYGLTASSEPGVDPKGTNGFNIEGLTMMAGSANAALVGFRAPIVSASGRTFALLVPVLNFADLAASGAPPGSSIFGPPVELDLYGRGVRSIEGNISGYIIVGGPPISSTNKYPMDFRLYTWNGDRNQNAQQHAADLSGLNPEGIVELPPPPWTANTVIQLLSDNGTTRYYGDEVEAKHLPVPNFKKCRSDFVTLGEIVKPAPIILSSEFGPFGANITWRSLKGETYRLQYSYTLELDSWFDVPGDVLATGPYASKTDPQGQLSECFYRVLVL